MPEFETKNMNYVLVPQIEYLCMLEQVATWLVNQAILERFANNIDYDVSFITLDDYLKF